MAKPHHPRQLSSGLPFTLMCLDDTLMRLNEIWRAARRSTNRTATKDLRFAMHPCSSTTQLDASLPSPQRIMRKTKLSIGVK